LGLAIDAGIAFDRDAIWSFALRLSAAHETLSGWSAPGGTADFALDVLALDLCPARLRIGPVDVRACAAGMGGRLRADGHDTYFPASGPRPFASAGGNVLLQMDLPARLAITASAGAGVTLVRDAFEFRPDVFHHVAPVTGVAALGLGLRLP